MEILYYITLYAGAGLLSLLLGALIDGDTYCQQSTPLLVVWPITLPIMLGIEFSLWLIEKNDNLK